MSDSGHAVVVGSSVGGMCAARALRSKFGKVTILEADHLPIGAEGRRGTPQGLHPHFLLARGRESIEQLFPGFTDQLTANGGRTIDPGLEAANCLLNGWAARSKTGMEWYFASRPMIESTIREFVRADAGIEIIEGARVSDLLSRDGVVTGVSYGSPAGEIELSADFVIDAGGRGSRASGWMKDFGQELEELTLDAKVSYSSRWYRWPADDTRWYRFLTSFPDPSPGAPTEHQYLCSVFPIENDSFIAIMGSWGQDMPTTPKTFHAAAWKSRTREFPALLEASEPLSDVHHTRSTRNVWRRYDRLQNPPRAFLALGDAVCAFNPIYAQGMSCAATGALMVRELADVMDINSAGFPKAFYAKQSEFLNGAWVLALSRDAGYEKTSGTMALPEGFRKRLVRRSTWPVFQFVTQACWVDSEVQYRFDRVYNLQESIFEMLRNPKVIAGLIKYGVTSALGLSKVPPPVPAHLPAPDTDYTELRNKVMGNPATASLTPA